MTQFCDWVGEFVRTRHVDIILGDFNINLLGKPVATLLSALKNFIQIAKEPTRLSGSLIMFIYQQAHKISEVINIFFCLKNPVIVFKINVNSSVLFKI